MKRPRFTLRALLVLTALVAAFCWWYVQPKRGTITEGQVSHISTGMTKAELVSLLGRPLEREDALASEWEYVVATSSRESSKSSLTITFDKQERVETAERWLHIDDGGLGIMINP